MITVSPGVRQFQTIHHWQHPYGPAHCLVRLHLPDGGPAVAVVSEIRSNSDERRFGLHFPTLADALVAALPPGIDVRPEDIRWVTHLGEFSSYDAIDAPEDFLHVVLDWDGGRYRGDMRGHHIMSERDIADLRNDVSLAPVPDVLRELGWTY